MPVDIGTQIVTLIHYTSASSPNVNRRHQDIRQLGIYQGGRLTVVDGPTRAASLSTLVCEISDGTYQVKVETTTAISLTAVAATPYFVLRWTYVGAASDFMEILAVATPLANDLVVAKCTFTGGGALQGFDYGDSTYPRSTPNTQDLFLKVEPTEDTELKVRIRSGRVQSNVGTTIVIDQKSSIFTAPSANSKVYLVYIDPDDGTVNIDSSGTEAASPVAPSYVGKLVLAEVTLASTDTNITAAKIKDVRSFITPPIVSRNATFSVTKNDAQAITKAVWTQVQLNDEEFDANAVYNSVTYQFVAPATGKYLFSAGVGLTTNILATDQFLIALYVNGVLKRYSPTFHGSAADIIMRISLAGVLLSLTALDTVDVRVYCSSTTNKTTTNVATENYFSGLRVE